MSEAPIDVAVIGAGPAGMAAALRLCDEGVAVTVLDEQLQMGGQILRQPPRAIRVRDWLPGRIYDDPKDVLRRAQQVGLDVRTGSTVWGIFVPDRRTPVFDVRFVRDGMGHSLRARRVIVASGCIEQAVAFPGWQLPGVMPAGGLQALLKSQQVIAGERIVLAGSHPLLLVVAQQLLTAGARLEAVLFAQPWPQALALARDPLALMYGVGALRHAASAMLELRRHRVSVRFGAAVVEAYGEQRLEGIRWAPVRHAVPQHAESRELPCDVFGFCFGFLPASELARQAGARAIALPHGGHAIHHDGAGRTDVAGLYVAGEPTGVKGANAAIVEGQLAAMSVLEDAGRSPRLALERRRAARRLRRHQRFSRQLAMLSTMPDRFFDALLTDDTLVCRCEDVDCGPLRRALAANPLVRDANALKLLARPGMGLCQGRYCEITVARLLRQTGIDPGAGFRPRPPVRPVPVHALCDAPSAEAIRWDDLHSVNDPEHR